MADISFVWKFDDDQARAFAQTRLDHAISEARGMLIQQGSEWCESVNDAIGDMKRDDCNEVATIGMLAQMGMLAIFAHEVASS